jgi:Na+-driven multidrug efflux pump
MGAVIATIVTEYVVFVIQLIYLLKQARRSKFIEA